MLRTAWATRAARTFLSVLSLFLVARVNDFTDKGRCAAHTGSSWKASQREAMMTDSLPSHPQSAIDGSERRRRAQRVLYDLSVVFGRSDLAREFLRHYTDGNLDSAGDRAPVADTFEAGS